MSPRIRPTRQTEPVPRRTILRRVLAHLGTGAVVLLVVAPPAGAHDPIFLEAQDTTPAAGPLIPDGTISFAVYGVLDAPGATRALQVRMADDAPLLVDLLVPDREPESGLTDADVPTLTLRSPDGAEYQVGPIERVRFAEPFSGTDYIRLARLEGTAQAGVYDLVVTGPVPARFTIAIGSIETFGTPVERVTRPAAGQSMSLLQTWYETPPPRVPPTTLPPSTTVAPSTTLPEPASSDPAPGLLLVLLALGVVAVGATAVVLSTRPGRPEE